METTGLPVIEGDGVPEKLQHHPPVGAVGLGTVWLKKADPHAVELRILEK